MRDFYTNPRITQYNATNKGGIGHIPDEVDAKKPKINSIDDLPIHVDSIKNEIIRLQKYQDRFGYTIDIPNLGYKTFGTWLSEIHNPKPPYMPRSQAYNTSGPDPNSGVMFSLAILGLYLIGEIGKNKEL